MRKSTLLKIAMTLTAMFFISGVFAQINLTVKNSDGSAANGAIVYTINSTTGVSADVATDGALGDADATVNGVIRFTPTANFNYIVRNAAGTAWNTFSGSADATVVLRANFTVTMNDYVSGYNADKITINKSMPFWVYPSPVHNPAWTVPAGNYRLETEINQGANLLSTFTWNIGGGTDASVTANDNYVELSWNTVGAKTITVQEAAATAYGGCTGPVKTFFFNVIDLPYLEFTNGADNVPNYTVGGGATGLVILSECESVGTTINPTISRGDNTNEEYPYYIKMEYAAYNATIVGSNIVLGAKVPIPTNNRVLGDITATDSVCAANPLIIDGTVRLFNGSNEYALFGATAKSFPAVNNKITVYEFDMKTEGWNAGISRKSDYLAFRNNRATANALDWTDARYSWITDNNGGVNRLKAYIVILPAPATGPIYHIPNTWGL